MIQAPPASCMNLKSDEKVIKYLLTEFESYHKSIAFITKYNITKTTTDIDFG